MTTYVDRGTAEQIGVVWTEMPRCRFRTRRQLARQFTLLYAGLWDGSIRTDDFSSMERWKLSVWVHDILIMGGVTAFPPPCPN